jgi:hypothetical protein
MTHSAAAALNVLELFRFNEQRVLVTFGQFPGFARQSMKVIAVDRPPVILPRPMLNEMALIPGEYDEPLARVTFLTDTLGMDAPLRLTLEVFSAERLAEIPGISLHVGFGTIVYVSPLRKPTPEKIAETDAMLDLLL